MKKIISAALVLAIITTLLIPSVALAAPNSKVDLIEDTADGVLDMDGPVVGFVNTNQDEDGNLRVVIKVKGATPLTTYTIYLTGNATHDTATGYIDIGTLTTNENGIGNSGEIIIDAATAQAPPLGAGPHHLDIGDAGDGKWFTSTPIPYSLP